MCPLKVVIQIRIRKLVEVATNDDYAVEHDPIPRHRGDRRRNPGCGGRSIP